MEALCFSLFPILNFLGAFLLPESPNWLVSKGRPEEARIALEWLKRDDVNWVTEVDLKFLSYQFRAPKLYIRRPKPVIGSHLTRTTLWTL